MNARRLPLLIVGIIGTSAALLVHCSCGGTGDPADASSDQPNDAKPRDTSADDAAASEDVGADVRCAAQGQVVHDFAGYTRVTALDPCCAVDVPDDLATPPSMSWEPCSTGRPSCQQFKVTWTNPDGPKRFAFGRRYRAANGAGSFEVGLWHSKNVVEDVVYDLATGATLKAWRSDQASQCFASSAANTNLVVPIAFAQGEPFRLAAEPRDAGAMLDATYFGLGDATLGKVDAIGKYDMTDSTLAMWMGATGAIVVGPPKGPFRRGTTTHVMSDPFVYGTMVLALAEHGNAGYAQLDHVALDGTIATYLALPAVHVSAPAVEDGRVFWVQASGGATSTSPPSTCELWSAPVSDTTPSAPSRSKVGDLPLCGVVSESFAADGYLAIRLGPDKLVVVRASDGAMRAIDATPNRHFGAIANVTATEVWAPEAGDKGTEFYLGIVRIAYPTW